LSTLYKELKEETKLKWQKNWEESPKAAQTKQFYPCITDRLKLKIDVTPKLHSNSVSTRENQSLPTPIQNIEKCNMSLQQGRSDYGPLDIPLHLTSTTKGNTQEGH
jgi:hypothetical protein